MNISYNWIKDYLNIELTPEDTSAALTSIGLETESVNEIESIRGGLEGIVIGEVLTCVEHPNSDHLHITTVNVGEIEPLKIVCGASNIAEGQKVMVALVGAKLYDGEESFVIKKSKIRGEESFGMICAEDEIGIGNGHDGIIVLPSHVIPGTLAKDYYNVKSDYILEVDITPNRVDATSHWGVARDLYALLKQQNKKVNLVKPSVDKFCDNQIDGEVKIKVENTEACPRYAGLTIKDIEVRESPKWLKDRLNVIGLHPINNIVDITNYILHEFGHPLHAFDLKTIQGNEVVVKTVAEGTKFVTLDGVERSLSSNDLMICNTVEPMCIGGVFGGLKSGVTDTTTAIFLECAYFNPTSIRKTARRHGLSTDASFRFERGCDPNDVLYILKHAALLIQELAGGKIAGPIQDYYPEIINPFNVSLSYDKVNSLIGKIIPKDTVKAILTSLEIQIKREDDKYLQLAVPTYRVDVQRDVDIIEDILRIYGYNNIEFTDAIKSNLSYRTNTDKSCDLQNLISEQLTGCGFYEILNNSLTREAYYSELSTYSVEHLVRLLNPLSLDLNVMRQTLLFGGLESIAYNKNRKNNDIRFYEFGSCYYYNSDLKADGKSLAEYTEEYHLGLWLSGDLLGNWSQPEQATSFYQLKAYVENIFNRLGLLSTVYEYKESVKDDCYDLGLDIYLKASGKLLGSIGCVNKQLLKALNIQNAEVFFAEFNWNTLLNAVKKHKVGFSEISKYPSVKRDLALLIDKKVKFQQIENIAFNVERKLLKRVSLFDVYEGKNLPVDKKSYAVSFLLQDDDRTLNDKQIDAIMKKIQMALEANLEAQLR